MADVLQWFSQNPCFGAFLVLVAAAVLGSLFANARVAIRGYDPYEEEEDDDL